MGKFKVGDRVRDVSYNDLLATVTSTDGNRVCVLYDGDMPGSSIMWSETDFVPVAEVTGTAATGKPKFKVGDIVKRAGGLFPEQRLSITAVVHPDSYSVEWVVGGPGSTTRWHAYEFELAEPPLTIREGAYYRTRDGRKVGPMRKWSDFVEHPWEEDRDGGDLYQDGGADFDEVDPIIAEWVDEPANAKPDTSTTGFTVPLCAEDEAPRDADKTTLHMNVDFGDVEKDIDRLITKLEYANELRGKLATGLVAA